MFAPIAVPWFFCVSGYFLATHFSKEGWYKDALKKRIRTLAIPFFFWSMAWLLFNLIFSCAGALLKGHSVDFSILADWTMFGFDFFNPPSLFPLWFLRMLILLVVVCPMLRINIVTTFLAMIIANVVYNVVSEDMPRHWTRFFYYGVSLRGLMYFTFGILLRENKLTISKIVGIVSIVLFFLCGLCRVFYFSANGGNSEMAIAFCGLIAAWSLMPSYRLPNWIYTIPFPLYVLHLFFIQTMVILMPDSGKSITRLSLLYVTTIAGSILSAFAIKRISPKIASIVFGGRA